MPVGCYGARAPREIGGNRDSEELLAWAASGCVRLVARDGRRRLRQQQQEWRVVHGPATTGGVKTGDDPNAKPVKGGSLIYGLEADTSGGFCLYKAQLAIGGIQVARTIYDTLTLPGADGKIHPYLAESVMGTKNNTVWTIKLRPGIKFHDGSPLTAAVVKDNLDHYRKDNPLFVFVFPDVKSVDVVDDLTLTVSTKRPWTAFPWFLWSSSRLGIMGKAQMESPDCNTKLIGTGPFAKVSWKFGDKFVAKRNPNYWDKDKDGVQLPYLDQITYVPQEDGPKRLGSLEAGDFQMSHFSGPLQIVKIRDDVKSGKLTDTESDKFTEVGYMMLNATKPPFNHLSARQAFAYAVDRDTYNRLRNDSILTNASGPFAPGVDGHLDRHRLAELRSGEGQSGGCAVQAGDRQGPHVHVEPHRRP